MKKYVIIVAGGKGLRMGGDIPKQFLPIAGLPVLMWTIKRFYDFDNSINIVLVLPKVQVEYWQSLCKKYDFNLHYQLAEGGESRFHSVKNGLSKVLDSDALVAVHDGVRPFVSEETIKKAFAGAETYGAIVPVIDSVDSIREIFPSGENEAKIRKNIKLVQTPQVFDYKLIKEAYSQDYCDDFTDDASVVEKYGHRVFLTEGNRENIKLTTPFDMKVAELLIG